MTTPAFLHPSERAVFGVAVFDRTPEHKQAFRNAERWRKASARLVLAEKTPEARAAADNRKRAGRGAMPAPPVTPRAPSRIGEPPGPPTFAQRVAARRLEREAANAHA